MDIPHRIPSAVDALAAIDGYLSWCTPGDLERAIGFAPWSVQLANGHRQYLAKVLDGLASDPGPGPGVQVESPGKGSRTVGNPLRGRGLVCVVKPERTAYGPVVTDALAQLAELATGVEILRALVARCVSCAAVDRDNNRNRTAERLEREAAEMAAHASDLESSVEPIGAIFLGQWRAEAARMNPQPKRGPLSRSVQLR